jgi:site-specific DNA-methyltransferase (adenine-specific)
MFNQIIHSDCFDVLQQIPDNSIDAVITDPPYGIGLAKWDSIIDIPLFTREVKRVTNGFYCFFGQMPTMVNWINEASQVMQYKDHIAWIKRQVTQCNGLQRSHESIFVYKHKGVNYFNTKGKYEDVKVPGILFDVVSIESIQRHLQDLKGRLKGNINPWVHNGKSQETYQGRFDTRIKPIGARSPDTVNFTNVWSFLPPTHTNRNNKVKFQHPTQKPIEVVKRLIELTTPPGGTVLDPFCGSGTTALACKELGRNYICIEKELEYYRIACNRLNQPIEHIPDEPIEEPEETVHNSPLQLALF